MSYNEIFATLLGRLSTAMSNIGEQMRAKAYKAAEEAILGITTPITSVKDLDNVPKIGTTIKQKLQEYLDTNKIKALEEYESRPENIFINVYGIGPKKASELVKKGIMSIDDLKARQDEVLNSVQKTGLKYYNDVLKRIPRSEIILYDKLLRTLFIKLKHDARYEIVGSYRRGQQSSGDIDVILTAIDPEFFDRFLDVLIEKKIIVEVLSRGKSKCLVIAKIPSSKVYRRVDFLFATPEEYPFSVLYFTGSKAFNVVMRGHALKMGYSMNEHGFTPAYNGIIKDERDIFDVLGLEYKSPEERVDGRAVVPITNTFSSSSSERTISEYIENSPQEMVPIKGSQKKIPKKGLKGNIPFDSQQILTEVVDLADVASLKKEKKTEKKTRKKREPKKKSSQKSPSIDSQRTISEDIRLSDNPEGPIDAPIEESTLEPTLKKEKKKEKKTRKKREPKKKSSRKSPSIDSQRTISEDIHLSDNPEGPIEAPIEETILEPTLKKEKKTEKKTRKKREPKKKSSQKSPSIDSQRTISEDIHLSDNPEEIILEPTPKKERKTRKKREPKKKSSQKSPSIDSQRTISEDIRLSDNPERPIEAPIEETILEPTLIKEKKTRKREHNKDETLMKKEINISIGENTMNIVKDFKAKGLPVLEPLSEKVLNKLIQDANDAYYNENPLFTDNEYDIIKEYTEKKYPKSEAICAIGAPIKGKNKVQLPFEMASMDKIKPDSGALASWMTKYTGPYVLSCKLDGVSGLYTCSQKGEYKLYTRGDGCVGQDISHLINVLNLPKISVGMAVRGEFIIPKSVFSNKYAKEFANARNLVSGIINRKSQDEKSADLHFVTYEVIQPVLKPSEQLKTLHENGFQVVQNKTVDTLSNSYLSDLLLDWRANYEYEIDGVIVTNDEIYKRVSGNPDHAFAFKMVLSDQLAEAKVVDVLWEASKDGYLKPRVRIEPIQLAGVKIEYATGFNGKFIEDNKIGIGAVITMVRSGDVIPYIKSVTVPAEKAKMPLVDYIWNKTHVDILLEKPHEDEGVQEKNITAFFVTLEVDGLAKGNIHKLYKAGKTTIAQILKMNAEDFEKVEGFQKKTANKLADGIKEKVDAASLLTIMVASGKLGRGLGERKIRPILEAYPDILTSPEDPAMKETKLKSIPGIGPENAREFVKNIPDFMEFVKETGLEAKLTKPIPTPTAKETVEGPFTGKKIVMTKVRDQSIISFVTNQGGSFEDNMKKDVFVLIVKSKEDVSNKTEYANKNGIPIMTVEEFKERYM